MNSNLTVATILANAFDENYTAAQAIADQEKLMNEATALELSDAQHSPRFVELQKLIPEDWTGGWARMPHYSGVVAFRVFNTIEIPLVFSFPYVSVSLHANVLMCKLFTFNFICLSAIFRLVLSNKQINGGCAMDQAVREMPMLDEAINTVEIVVHISESLEDRQRNNLVVALREEDSIVSAEFCSLRHHLMLVRYDRDQHSSQDVLNTFKARKLQARLIGPI